MWEGGNWSIYSMLCPFRRPFLPALYDSPFWRPFQVALSGSPFWQLFLTAPSDGPFRRSFPTTPSDGSFQRLFPTALSDGPFQQPFPKAIFDGPFWCQLQWQFLMALSSNPFYDCLFNSMNGKLAITRNRNDFFSFTETLRFMSILWNYLRKCENWSLHSDNLYKFCYQTKMIELQISYSGNSKGLFKKT